jgi:FlaA1/EpsC-like NDP-sugar epimerase
MFSICFQISHGQYILEILSWNKVQFICRKNPDITMESVESFFADKCVFITGATGFLGKVLLEKLLRSCQRIKRIYVLTRARADMTPQQRIDKILQSKVNLILELYMLEENKSSYSCLGN